MQSNNFDLTVAKESAIASAQSNIDTLINGVMNGEMEALAVYATFDKLEKMFKESKVKVEEQGRNEAEKYGKTFKFHGVSFTLKNGGTKLDYEVDHVYSELTGKLKARKELLDIVHKTGQQLFDDEGIEVPCVPVKTHIKDSLIVKF